MYSNSDNFDCNWCSLFYTDTLCLHTGLEVSFFNIYMRNLLKVMFYNRN